MRSESSDQGSSDQGSSGQSESVRLARPDDLAELTRLTAAAVAELGPARGGSVWTVREARPAPWEPSLLEAIGDPNQLVLVALIDDVVFGFAVAHYEDLRDRSVLTVIDDIYVEPDARCVGLGEFLMKEITRWAELRGCSGIDAFVLPGNREAKNFFESAGLVARAIVVHRSLR